MASKNFIKVIMWALFLYRIIFHIFLSSVSYLIQIFIWYKPVAKCTYEYRIWNSSLFV